MGVKLLAILSSLIVAFCFLSVSSDSGVSAQGTSANVDTDDKVYGSSQVDKKAVIDSKSWVASAPSAAGCGKRQGSVLLKVILRKSGKVTDVVVHTPSRCESFDERAVKAAQKVKFKPAQKGGVPVSEMRVFQYNYNVW